ncbi:MAG TPA: rRNA maturation RNase YbeY [Frankiaceae bacterium]|nr:rRNA maturation RNase YbeY [Frankiaceae bacterium]
MSVFLTNESGVAVDEVTLVALARHVLGELEVDPLAELSIMLVEVAVMERLHVQYMGEEGPTDVLAFQQDDLAADSSRDESDEVPTALLGDVVLCPEIAARQARRAGHSRDDELALLCTHGVLHLLGYDHADPEEEREMFATQGRLLASWRTARAAGIR